MNDRPLKTRAANATWWSTLEIASRYCVQILVTIILARLLQPADFALIAMLLVFTTIATILIYSSFGSALIQRQQTSVDDETTAFLVTLGTGLCMAAVLWSCAPAIAGFYRQPELVPLMHLIVWILPLGGLAAVPDAMLTKRLNFVARTRTELVASSVSGCAAVALAWHGYGVWSIGCQIVLAGGLRAGLLWHAARWMPRGRFTLASLHRLFGFGSFLLLTHLLDEGFVRLQILLLGRLFAATTLGYYTLAQAAQQAPTSFIETVLYRVGLPVFSEVSAEPARLRDLLRRSARVSLFIFMPCMVCLALLAQPFIELIYGAKWREAAPMLAVLAVAASLWPLQVLNITAITALGRSNAIFQAGVIKRMFAIILVVASSPFGPLAVACSVLISNLFTAVVNAWYSKRLLGYDLFMQLSDLGATLVWCAAAAAVTWETLHWVGSSILGTTLGVILGGAVYLGGALLSNSPALRELVNVGREFRDRRSPKLSKG